jgi:hypothetical protein
MAPVIGIMFGVVVSIWWMSLLGPGLGLIAFILTMGILYTGVWAMNKALTYILDDDVDVYEMERRALHQSPPIKSDNFL